MGKNIYLLGELTNHLLNENAKMEYNVEKGIYEKALFLKQGYYSYTYVTKDLKGNAAADFESTEGNAWQTENDYTVFVYYRSLSDRHDELVGITTINSRMGKL